MTLISKYEPIVGQKNSVRDKFLNFIPESVFAFLTFRQKILYSQGTNTNFYYTTEENMKVKPLADKVLVKLEKSETKSAGGIIIPDTAQEKTQIGAVVAVGDDKEVIKVKAGQKVMYDKYAGTQVKIGAEEHLIIKMSDILAIIE